MSISYFHENRSMDVDNLAKPILDGLKGVVFVDDAQVTELVCRKVNLTQEINVPVRSQILLNALSNEGGFVHILVETTSSQGVIV